MLEMGKGARAGAGDKKARKGVAVIEGNVEKNGRRHRLKRRAKECGSKSNRAGG